MVPFVSCRSLVKIISHLARAFQLVAEAKSKKFSRKTDDCLIDRIFPLFVILRDGFWVTFSRLAEIF